MPVDLDKLVGEVAELAADYADLDFTAPYGRLDIRKKVPDVTCLRIELLWPGMADLRLASVAITADGLDDPVAQTVRRISSNASQEFADLLDEGALFKAKRRRTAVHTKKEHRPWLEIEFREPVDLRRVRVRNAGGRGAHGSSTHGQGIQLQVRTTDGWWTTLYDGWQREREFVQLVERQYGGSVFGRQISTNLRRRAGRTTAPQDHRLEGDLIKILAGIQVGTYNSVNIFKDLNRLELPPDEVAHLQRLVNDKLLMNREMEFNPHSIRRTFRYWSKEEKRRYLSFSVDVANCLRELNGNACLGFGSVLAVVRDQDLIPHDDDLDVIIGFEPDQAATLADGLNLVHKHLKRNGFKVVGRYTAHTWVIPPGGGLKVDAFVGTFEGDRIGWFPSRRGLLTRDMLFPTSTRRLWGVDCPVPRQPENYLEAVYGPGWTEPDPHYQHPKDRSEWSGSKK